MEIPDFMNVLFDHLGDHDTNDSPRHPSVRTSADADWLGALPGGTTIWGRGCLRMTNRPLYISRNPPKDISLLHIGY